MPRIVLLYHRCPPGYARPTHWDLMLENGDMLRTWALLKLPLGWQAAHEQSVNVDSQCPPLAASNEIEAERLPEHRRDFLDYQGDLSGQRGSVISVAFGTYRVKHETPTCITCELKSEALPGWLKLRRENDRTLQWTLEYGKSRCAPAS